MKVKRIDRAVALIFVVGWAGCSEAPSGASLPNRATSVIVYEGLPHQTMESSAFEAEKHGSKLIFEFAGYSFYREPLTLKPDDLDCLRRTLGDRTIYEPFREEKK